MNFPQADAVGGDLITASKALVLHGWATPGVLTARVAYEAALWRAIDARRLRGRLDRRARPIDASRLLRRCGVLTPAAHEENAELYGMMSHVAHGRRVGLFAAHALVERAERQLEVMTS